MGRSLNRMVKLNKKIIITSEIDLNSEVAKEYLATVSLNDVKENYADTPYTCK